MIVSTLVFLAFPVALIWHADDLAVSTGQFVEWHRVSNASPALLVKLCGFLILFSPEIVYLFA